MKIASKRKRYPKHKRVRVGKYRAIIKDNPEQGLTVLSTLGISTSKPRRI